MNFKILRINFRRFINNKLFIISTLIYFCVSIGYLIISLYRDIQAGDDLFQFVYPLWKTNTISIYSFAFFLLLSYAFCARVKANTLYETVCCVKNGLLKLSGYNVIVLTIWNLIYSFILLVYNTAAFLIVYSFDKAYIIHICLNILINIFLINTFAIVFGLAVSFFKSKILSYSSMIIFLLMGSKIGESLAGMIVIATDNGFNVFQIFNLFNIFPPNMDWTPTYAMGFSVLPYRIILIAAWLFLAVTVAAFCIKKSRINVMSVISLIMVIALLVLYFRPESKLVLNNDPDGEAMSDQYYYSDYAGESISPKFNVEKYYLDIKIGRELSCCATIVPDSSIDAYVFTLYHGYRINKVTNQEGEELEYNRDGDYIEIFADEPLSSIKIDYSGNGKGFYSNYQGIYLAGDFPYYPVAGKQVIFSDYSYISVVPSNTPEFEITVSSNLQIYSNLNSDEENVFYGKTKTPCLFSGFLAAEEYMGVTIIYPYLYGETVYLDDILQNMDLDRFYGKTIFIEPHVNISFETSIREYDDVVLTPNLSELISVESEGDMYD